MKTGIIIVAAGDGARAGGTVAKQFRDLGGRPVLDWSIAASREHRDIDDIVLVLPASMAADDPFWSQQGVITVKGGATRTASVRAGLDRLGYGPDDIVLIHDAARPGLSAAIIDRLLTALDRADAAAPMLPVVDALKRRSDEGLSTIDREQLVRIQTPQAFRFGHIRTALDASADSFVDDLAAIEATGRKVALVDGSERLAKLTYPEDFERMTQILGVGPAAQMRIGSGFDVHALGPGDSVTLCGVTIAHTHALVGHSDADVAWHALTDALLGAAALGDIGDHFPPSDPQWRGVASSVFLEAAVRLVREAGYQIANCDLTLICEEPTVKPHRQAMRERTAEILDIALTSVSIKATTTEQLGFTGRGEGIAAQASVLLSSSASQA